MTTSPTQDRRRLLTRFAIKVAAAKSHVEARAIISELVHEIESGYRETIIEILANSDRNAVMPVGGPRDALMNVSNRCRAAIEELDATRLMGSALHPVELPPHILPYPAPPEEPLALRVSIPSTPNMHTTFWLNTITPEDLDAMALWLRTRKAHA
jgi:hypothetical protein